MRYQTDIPATVINCAFSVSVKMQGGHFMPAPGLKWQNARNAQFMPAESI